MGLSDFMMFQSLLHQVHLSDCGYLKAFQEGDLRCHFRKAALFEKDRGEIFARISPVPPCLVISIPHPLSIFPKARILRKSLSRLHSFRFLQPLYPSQQEETSQNCLGKRCPLIGHCWLCFFAPQQYSSCSVTSLRDLYHFFATVHLSHDHLRDRMESRISGRLTTSATSYAGGSDSGIRFKRAIDGKCPIFP